MEAILPGYRKKKEYLICVDSDGCAIDSMDIKHFQCFGPCMIQEWNLEVYQQKITLLWNHINLYSMTRGINRFKGLAKALEIIDREMTPIEDLDSLIRWVENTQELSNRAVEKAADEQDSICLKKALHWSECVNQKIRELPKETVSPFSGVRENLELLHETCDIAVVSSANLEAVEEEWTRFGLIEHVDAVLAQNAGSKQSCIEKLLTFGYDKDKVMMVGDAPGDMDAAKANGVFYYPVLVTHEPESWENIGEAAEKLQNGTFAGGYQEKLIQDFVRNLRE